MSSTKKHQKKLKRQQKVREQKLAILEEELSKKRQQKAQQNANNPQDNQRKQGQMRKPQINPKKAQSVANYMADKQGCGYFRCIWPAELLGVYKNLSHQSLTQYVFDMNWLTLIRSIRFQRASDPIHRQAWDAYLSGKQQHGYVYQMHYEIDDLLMEIEPTNEIAYKYFNSMRKENHLHMLRTSDKVIFSTDPLKNRYVEKYGIDPAKIMVVPNTLPQCLFKFPKKYAPRKFWTPDDSDPDNWKDANDPSGSPILNGYGQTVRESGRKPRIYWSGSSSHLGKDGDLEFIKELVEKTLDEYQWVFHGVVPPELEQHVESGKIEKIPWSVTYALPMTQYYRAQPDICLAPIKPGIFNQCKSDLKFLEAAALGAPCITSSFAGTGWASPYEAESPVCLENDPEIWKHAIDHLLNNPDYYMEVVNAQYDILKGRWMENHLDLWHKAMV